MPVQKSDVIVVGGGLAGMVTALELLGHGKKVTIIDRDDPHLFGGLARQAFGGMALMGSPLQRRMGIKDGPELGYRDWLSFAELGDEDVWPRRWAEYYVNNSIRHIYEWLQQKGLKFFPAVNWVERGLFTPGNSVPRYHVLWGTGNRLVEVLAHELQPHQGRNLQLLFRHAVTGLTLEGERVSGCEVTDELNGHSFTLHADQVVVATGGITGCIDKVKAHWYKPWGAPPVTMLNGSHPYADGKVHDMVEQMGGRLTHLDKMWNYAAGIPHPKPAFANHGLSLIPCKSALWLDARGRRIGPDPLMTGFDTSYLCQRVAQLPDAYTWQLLNWRIAAKEFAISGTDHNQSIRDRKLGAFLKEILLGNHRLIKQISQESDHFLVADSLPQLVEKMNRLSEGHVIDISTIEGVVKDYDDNIGRGKGQWNDDQLRRIVHARQWRSDKFRTCKPKPLLAPGNGPLIAIKLRLITRKSLGGIQTDLQSRVLNNAGQPMAGLYATGEAAGFGGGGTSGLRSLEGTFLPGCILTGQAAARSIVQGR